MAHDHEERVAKSRLADAVEDAQVLLSYTSQTGGSIDLTTVKTVVDTASAVRNGSVSNEQETAFWFAFNTLAKATSPISLSSLRATLDSFAPGGRSQARTVVTLYTVAAVAALGLLLVFQIYWLFGNSITGELQKQRKDIADLDAKIVATQIAAANSVKPAPSPNPELVALRTQLENLRMKRDASNELLSAWGSIWEKNSPVTSACNSGDFLEDAGKQGSCKNAVRYQAVLVVLNSTQI